MLISIVRRFLAVILLTAILGSAGASAAPATPSTGSVEQGEWVIVCTNRPGVSVAGMRDGSSSQFHEFSSRTFCDSMTGTRGVTTTMKIDAQYDPQAQLTMIRFEDDLGQSSFNVGVCEMTPGNLAVFVTEPDGSMGVKVLFVPTLCSSQA